MSTNAMRPTAAMDRDRAGVGAHASATAAAPRTVGRQELNKVVLASVVGSFVEWFEFSVYGYLASVLGRVFFPAVGMPASNVCLPAPRFLPPSHGMRCCVRPSGPHR